jgi:Phospholipid methyltransferase
VIFILARAATYSVLFIGLLLIFLPARILSSTAVIQPAAIGVWQVIGALLGASGAALALTCILTFVFVGRGTPAPFDPPRRLVIRGPYRLVRNPMYLSAGLALAGAALFYRLRCSATPACSCSSPTCLSCCTRSPHCDGPSIEITRRTVAGSVGGGRNSERWQSVDIAVSLDDVTHLSIASGVG